MFISADYLGINYGVDDKIAHFFVDREPPVNNLYWHEKLLYLRPAPGYLFIPLVVDLLFRLGINKQDLLSEKFIGTMEQIGHISALEETKKISYQNAIVQCSELVRPVSVNHAWLQEVNDYFNGGNDNILNSLATPFKALHRGDVFLYSLSAMQFSESLFKKIGEQWFALISTLLLLDDAEDLQSDMKTGEENAYLESGLNQEGIEKVTALVKYSVKKIFPLNSVLSWELDRQFTELIKMPHIHKLLNQPL